ncbi:MAG: rhodanese-like domain-containing protein [Bacteroidota bacterium]
MAERIKISDVLEAVVKKNAIIVDILEPDVYKKLHIKNAINVPVKNFEELMPEKVDPEKRVIVYGLDYEDPTARITAEKMEKMGYKNVEYYEGGKKEWLRAEMPVDGKES